MSYEIVEIKRGDPRYPALLEEIPDPPEQLYCRGNLSLLNSFCFGIVGTRKITSYGKEATEYITSQICSFFTIVSGLALGVDTTAHRTVVEQGDKTIAVLGTGIDDRTIFPQTNLKLAHEILEKDGLIISEYPP